MDLRRSYVSYCTLIMDIIKEYSPLLDNFVNNNMFNINHSRFRVKNSDLKIQFSKEVQEHMNNIFKEPYVKPRRNLLSPNVRKQNSVPKPAYSSVLPPILQQFQTNKADPSIFLRAVNRKQNYVLINPKQRRFMSPKVRPIFGERKMVSSAESTDRLKKCQSGLQFTFGSGFRKEKR